MKALAIACGGAVGALLRYLFANLISQKWATQIPWGIIIVNLTGSYIIGFLSALFERFIISNQWKTFLLIGFLGAFTTFSTYIMGSFLLFQEKSYGPAFLNIFISTVCGLIMVFLGFASARALLNLRM